MVDERYLSVASMSSLPVEILLLLDISSIPTIQSRTCLLIKGVAVVLVLTAGFCHLKDIAVVFSVWHILNFPFTS
ncbi:hypothetical protein H5410_002525 [Solanum commersonii]|uniref:Uncharacterized protein n=1 Tax=Solanum commersonii TaxID=4109 RepID=A0A9J6B2C3_SOLCO|nr:hypothetical protein H5410_002525 [Solanum commersonii]